MADDERVAHVEILRHFYHRVINGSIAVRMVLPHHIADDRGGFAELCTGVKAHLVHRVENAAMHGLQPVADIRERAGGDDRHRVIEVGLAHFKRDTARNNALEGREFWLFWLVFGGFFSHSYCLV